VSTALQLRLGYVIEQPRVGLGLYLAPTLPLYSWTGEEWIRSDPGNISTLSVGLSAPLR